MRFIALNEETAAFLPTGTSRKEDPRAALNRLMTVSSWRSLIDFLKTEACNNLFAKREARPLVTRSEYNSDDYYFEELAGSLKARIDKDVSIDYLDGLTQADLLAQGEVYELSIPELLSWRKDISSFLVLAAVSLGAAIPDSMFEDFSFDMYEWERSEDFDEWLNRYFDNYFGDHGPIEGLSFSMDYWPATDCGPYWYDGPFLESFDECELAYCQEERTAGILAGGVYLGRDSSGQELDFSAIFYDSSRYSRSDACRLFCGLTVANIICATATRHVNEGHFSHDYVDEPDYGRGVSFSLSGGYQRPEFDSGFERWQQALVYVADDAAYNNRIVLCPTCGTPIVARSEKSRVEYCCESHKTIASKLRRQRAYHLFQKRVPIEDAIAEIGEAYAASIKKWYNEAARYDSPSRERSVDSVYD